MSASFYNARSANGPRLAAWVESVVPSIPTNARRYLNLWAGAPLHPSYYEVDHVLVPLGIHPSVVPEHVWRLAAPTQPSEVRCPICRNRLSNLNVRDRHKTCSRECAQELRRRKEAARPRASKPCGHCGERFERPRAESEAEWSKRVYCSPECRILGSESPWYRGRKRKALAA